MKFLVLLFCVLHTFGMEAQYYEAKLLLTDGSVKDGFANLPNNGVLDDNIEFKQTLKGDIEKIAHDDLKQILYTSDDGIKFLFERNNVVHLYKSFGKEWEHEKVEKHWMLLIYVNDVLQEYSLAQRYKIDKKGKMVSITGGNSFWSTVYFLFRRPQEDKAYIVSGIGFTNGMVRKAMASYFKDIPEFVERIENKEFKKANVKDVADEYAKYF